MKVNAAQSANALSVKQNVQSDDPVIKNARSRLETLQKHK